LRVAKTVQSTRTGSLVHFVRSVLSVAYVSLVVDRRRLKSLQRGWSFTSVYIFFFFKGFYWHHKTNSASIRKRRRMWSCVHTHGGECDLWV